MRAMETEFGETQKVCAERDESNSILQDIRKLTHRSREFLAQIEEHNQRKENAHSASAVDRCLLCDPDWCPAYKRGHCEGKESWRH